MLSFTFGRDSDGPVEKIPINISQEFLENLPVAGVVWQVFVKFRSNSSDFSQIIPRGIGEIVMLQVISEIKVENIPKTDIVVGFLSFNELVMLGDDVNGCWVGSNGAKSCKKEEKKSPRSPDFVYGKVCEKDEEIVQGFIASQAGVLHEDGSKRIEELDD